MVSSSFLARPCLEHLVTWALPSLLDQWDLQQATASSVVSVIVAFVASFATAASAASVAFAAFVASVAFAFVAGLTDAVDEPL